ncbi:pyridoxamine 5'-phosphate oxidase [Subtercola endophyticus]|uniref:pyridoxamine 5'-phosphate oxidase n=1 Tax=Subtercola endophyticus TaxID=2895559 RepID=UPI001E53136B|nr:pyridoxamine 5'-phosphate oxidase [Subtercola endophyticus]UFS60058.1 pyridoxamine 5'-phosphate oxidase [Subtercola endophyticus]
MADSLDTQRSHDTQDSHDSLHTHRDFGETPLDESDLDADPFVQFQVWLGEAEGAGLSEPNAMVLSTVDAEGTPSSRTVLLRGVRAGGFEFFTNYDSRKGRALGEHPVASALFPWYLLQRQVIIEGSVERVSAAESDAYFAGRPYKSQIAAIASAQSQPLGARADLERRVAELGAAHPEGGPVPRPEHWGGYRLIPSRIEFWKGRRSRLHDRLVYTPAPDTLDGPSSTPDARSWQVTRLQP